MAAKQQHPGIDDLQSSSSAALTAGGVELNCAMPGTALNVLKPDATNKAGLSSLPRGPNSLADPYRDRLVERP